MVPIRTALGLWSALAALLLLLPPEIASHAAAQQSPSQSAPADPARAERQARQEKLRQIQRDATALLRRASALPPESSVSKQLLDNVASQFESLAAEAASPPALL